MLHPRDPRFPSNESSVVDGTALIPQALCRVRAQILIHIDVAAAMRDGIKFHRSGNGVILSSGAGGVIGPKYFAKVTTMDGDEVEWR